MRPALALAMVGTAAKMNGRRRADIAESGDGESAGPIRLQAQGRVVTRSGLGGVGRVGWVRWVGTLGLHADGHWVLPWTK